MFFTIDASFGPEKTLKIKCLEENTPGKFKFVEKSINYSPGFYIFIQEGYQTFVRDEIKNILNNNDSNTLSSKRKKKSETGAVLKDSFLNLVQVDKPINQVNYTLAESLFYPTGLFDNTIVKGNLFRVIVNSNAIATKIYNVFSKNALKIFAVAPNRNAPLLIQADAKFFGNFKDYSFFEWSVESDICGQVTVPLKNVSKQDLETNRLPENPLATLPLISFDIEAICDDMNSFPTGLKRAEEISSISVCVEIFGRVLNSLFVLKPKWWTDDQRDNFISDFDSHYDTSTFFYDTEVELLKDFMGFVAGNSFVNDSNVPIYTGYNTKGFDYSYLYYRLWHHELYDQLAHIQPKFGFKGKNGLNDDFLNLDLFLVVKMKLRQGPKNLTLKEVSKFHCGGQQMLVQNLHQRLKLPYEMRRDLHLHYASTNKRPLYMLIRIKHLRCIMTIAGGLRIFSLQALTTRRFPKTGEKSSNKASN